MGAARASNPRARKSAAVVSPSGSGRVTRTAINQGLREGILPHRGDCTLRPRNGTEAARRPFNRSRKAFTLANDKPMLVLGIETTCDETAAAVVERQADGSGRILSDVVRSQTDEHARFGGVVPEIAARAHVALLDGIADRAMKDAGVGYDQLSAVAAAAGPGLIGGVIVGLTTAKA